MKRLPFKRQLIILASIIAALCIAIPVATFAKQSTPPPGAGEHHVSVQHSLQPAASGQPVTITADCLSPQPIVMFNKGDTVSGTAVIVTSSGDPVEEAAEHEDLQLQGTNVPVIPGNPFAVDSGTHNINFIATGSGTLTGCILPGVNATGYDGDEAATVTVTVTPPVTTVIDNPIWAGYAATGHTAHPVTYTEAKGSWTMPPKVTCPLSFSAVAFWVGLGGLNAPLEQIGTIAECTLGGEVVYHGVYEMVAAGNTPSHPVELDSQKFPVKPKDHIIAKVHYQGKGNYLLTLNDTTQKWIFSITTSAFGSDTNAARSSAECIVEDPPFFHVPNSVFNILVPLPLANFTNVDFSYCLADGKPIGGIGPLRIELVPVSLFGVTAQPSPLTGATAFSVKWIRDGYPF